MIFFSATYTDMIKSEIRDWIGNRALDEKLIEDKDLKLEGIKQLVLICK